MFDVFIDLNTSSYGQIDLLIVLLLVFKVIDTVIKVLSGIDKVLRRQPIWHNELRKIA